MYIISKKGIYYFDSQLDLSASNTYENVMKFVSFFYNGGYLAIFFAYFEAFFWYLEGYAD